MPNPSIKDEAVYRALLREGASQERAARIANAAAAEGRSAIGRRGGRSEPYEEWTVARLRDRAKELGLSGVSRLRKADLIEALREH